MKNRIAVVFSSHLDDEANQKFTNHILETIGIKNVKVTCYFNFNQFSLAEIYNRGIAEHNDENTIMVFCHNDIVFRTKNWGKMLLTKFNNSDFSIIGVAGTTYLADNGVWWTDRTKMCGVVEHTNGITTWVNEYSPPKAGFTRSVVLVDGLFIAADCSKIEHQFDEDFKGFHMYDLGFCVPNYLDGCNIGVTTDIRILHQSIGMTNEQWEVNRLQFVEKYKDDLPILETALDGTNNEDVLVNVITRTHNRPKHFAACKKSIDKQTHVNINHIVGTDTECDYYPEAIKLELQEVQHPKPEVGTYPAPWNLHLNELAKQVKEGWIIYLDDDDKFVFNNSVSIAVNNIDNEDQMILWRVDINGWVVPSTEMFGKIQAGNISGIGMMFHSKHLPVDWGSWSYGDFRVITQLAAKLKQKWIYATLTQTQGSPNNGNQPID